MQGSVCIYYSSQYVCRYTQNMHIWLYIQGDVFPYELIYLERQARSGLWSSLLLEQLWPRVISLWSFNKWWGQIEISEVLNI